MAWCNVTFPILADNDKVTRLIKKQLTLRLALLYTRAFTQSSHDREKLLGTVREIFGEHYVDSASRLATDQQHRLEGGNNATTAGKTSSKVAEINSKNSEEVMITFIREAL